MTRRQLRLDMGYRPDEFDQTLQGFCAARPPLHCSGSPPRWQLTDDRQGLKARIDIQSLPERRIGMLILPRLQVDLDIQSEDARALDAFMQGFHRHFHKGGG